MNKRRKYKSVFILAGALMIWLGVKLLLAALTAAAFALGAALVFAGMRVIAGTGKLSS